MSFVVLTVCTGNVCRSPLSERILAARLGGVDGVRVESAGTAPLAGHAMDERAAGIARAHGADPGGHAARILDADTVRGAGLILAMAREHRRAVVEMVPRASRVTFTLRELARLLGAAGEADLAEVTEVPATDTAGRLSMLVDVAAGLRGTVPPADPGEDDVVDPYRADDGVYAQAESELVPAAETVAAALVRAVTAVGV